MVDYGGLAILVIGGYILIKYGPQIAQQLQANAQQPQTTPDTTAPADAGGTTTPVTINMAPAPTSAADCGPGTIFDAASNQCITNTGAQAVNKTLQIFRQQSCAPGQQLLIINNQAQCVADTQYFPAAPKSKTPPAPACVNNTQDPACGFKGHPKCCPNNTLLGTPLQMAAGSGPAVSTRPAKTAPPKRTGTLNSQCEGNPCGVTIPGKCLQSSTGKMVSCTQNIKAGVAYSYMTQVVNGQKRTTIDPFFPAGFYLSQSNYRSSLREPALH